MKQLRILFQILLLALTVYQSDGRAQMVINSYNFKVSPTYVLDQVSKSNLAGAWSSRRLIGAYTGPADQVRRSSDNALADVGFLDENYNTSDLSAHVGGNSGFVRTRYDQSGNGRNLVQTSDSEQPRIVNSGTHEVINSRIAIRAVSDDHIQASVGSRNTTQFTLLLVISKGAYTSGGARYISTSYAGGNDYGESAAFNLNNYYSENRFGIENNAVSYDFASNNNTPIILSLTWNGTSHVSRINGAQVASVSTSNALRFDTLRLFKGIVAGQASLGSVCELVMYDRVLNLSELQTVENNMGAYYSIF